MREIEVVVRHEVGLHARPASLFVKLASKFPCNINVRNLTTGSQAVNAKSILSVLSLGVNRDNSIAIQADGEQADEALKALQQLVEDNFSE